MPASNLARRRHVFTTRGAVRVPPVRQCEYCEAYICSNKGGPRRRFCLTCKGKRAVDRANKHKTPEKHAEIQARRRARSLGPVIKYKQIADAYGTVCHLCDKDIDMSLLHPDPFSKSMDHVIPLSKGGAHTLDNLKLAHLRCNLRKGNRL